MRTFQQFMTEVSKEDLEKVGVDRDLHFDSIFGDKIRIVVPLEQDESLGEMVSELEGLGYVVDHEDLIKKKIVYKKVQTRQGEKLRSEKVGKVLQAAGLSGLLDWWQKNADGIGRSDVGSSIVISRSPIDILQMSDHDGITSCHSPDGAFYHCARQEAKTGGAVAYVVKNSDLKGVDINDQEIFEDDDRRVKGIVPLERLRLRRFTNDKLDLLVPERRTYGIKNVGFADAVRKWAKRTQEESIGKMDPQRDYGKFDLKGGSYQDSNADGLWSDFFGVTVSGRKSSLDQDEEEEDEQGNLYDRAQEALDGHNWDYASVDLNDYDGLSYAAYITLKIPEKLFASKEVRDALQLSYRTSLRGSNDDHEGRREILKRLRDIIFGAVEVDGLQPDIEVHAAGENYEFGLSFANEDYYGDNELNSFERFLDYVDEVDGEWLEKTKKAIRALMDAGYLKNLSQKLQFKNFVVEDEKEKGLGEEGFVVSTKQPEKVGHIKDFWAHKHHFRDYHGEITFNDWNKQFAAYVNRYKALPFLVDESKLKLFMKLSETQGARKEDWEQTSTNSWHQDDVAKITGWVYLRIWADIGLDAHKSGDVVSRLKAMDENWDFYMQKIWRLFEKFIRDQREAFSKVTATPGSRPPWNTGPQGDEMLAGGSYKLGINPLDGLDPKGLSKKPNIRNKQMSLGLKFKEWLYNGASAPDNNPMVAAKGRFLRMRQEVAEYIDSLAELGIGAATAREKAMEAFADRAAQLPEEMRTQIERLITSFTGLLYPHD